MALLDFLAGVDSLERQRDRAIQAASERFDPSDLGPIIEQARGRATEGLTETEEETARRKTLDQLFRPMETEQFGGDAARAVAAGGRRSQQISESLSDLERGLTQQNQQIKRQAEQRQAQAQAKARQTASQRQAAVEEANMQFEAERQRRRNQVVGTGLQIAGTLATIPFGGAGGAAGASLAQRGLSALFGGDGETDQPSTTEVAAEAARPQPQAPEDQMISPDVNLPEAPGVGSTLPLPGQQGQSPQTTQSPVDQFESINEFMSQRTSDGRRQDQDGDILDFIDQFNRSTRDTAFESGPDFSQSSLARFGVPRQPETDLSGVGQLNELVGEARRRTQNVLASPFHVGQDILQTLQREEERRRQLFNR